LTEKDNNSQLKMPVLVLAVRAGLGLLRISSSFIFKVEKLGRLGGRSWL